MDNEPMDHTLISQEKIVYDVGELEYLHINPEHSNPENNPLIVIPGFTQGIEALKNFGEALGEDGEREVFVLDQLKRNKKSLRISGKIGLAQQVDTVLEFLRQQELTHRRIDSVANSLGALVLAKTAIEANGLGWTGFRHEPDEEGRSSKSVLISSSGVKPNENWPSLGLRWLGWMIRNGSDDKLLDPTREFYKSGQQNALQDLPKFFNDYFAQSKYKIDFEELHRAGVRPYIVGYARDTLMPYQNATEYLEHIEGAHSLIDHADNSPTYRNAKGEEHILPRVGSFKEFKAETGLQGKEARKLWVQSYRAAEHNNLQFYPERTARFIAQVLKKT